MLPFKSFPDVNSNQLSGQFSSCAVTFASDSERKDFLSRELILLEEGSGYRVNIFDHFVEVKMPESFLQSLSGQALGDCILKQLTNQLYLPGTDVDDTGLEIGGSASIPFFYFS